MPREFKTLCLGSIYCGAVHTKLQVKYLVSIATKPIVVAMVLLYRTLGASMLSGVAIMALMVPVNFFMAKYVSS